MADVRVTPADHLDSYGRLWSVIGGILLLAGLLWPTIGVLWTGAFEFRGGWEFATSAGAEPIALYVFATVTAVAVALVGFFARGTRGRFRGPFTMVLGAVPVIWLCHWFTRGASVSFVLVLLIVTAILAMFVGARLIAWFPESARARQTAGVAGLVVLVVILFAWIASPARVRWTNATDLHRLLDTLTTALLPIAAVAAVLAAFVPPTVRKGFATVTIVAGSGFAVGSFLTSSIGIMEAWPPSWMPTLVPPMMVITKIWLIGVGGLLIPTCGAIEWGGRAIAGDMPLYDRFARPVRDDRPPPSVLCSQCGESVLLAHGRCNACGRKIGDDTRRMLIAAQAADDDGGGSGGA